MLSAPLRRSIPNFRSGYEKLFMPYVRSSLSDAGSTLRSRSGRDRRHPIHRPCLHPRPIAWAETGVPKGTVIDFKLEFELAAYTSLDNRK